MIFVQQGLGAEHELSISELRLALPMKALDPTGTGDKLPDVRVQEKWSGWIWKVDGLYFQNKAWKMSASSWNWWFE